MTDRGYELSAQFYDLFDRKPNINNGKMVEACKA